MGQYYKTIINRTEGADTQTIFTVDNHCGFTDYHGLKLMEHSYLNNEWTDAIAYFLYKNKARVAHVGDYAHEYPEHTLAYNDNVNTTPLDVSNNYDDNGKLIEFDYANKFFVNWDKKEYIDFNHWKEKNKIEWDDNSYFCPLTMLTALGNDRGGGDYHAPLPNHDKIGCWAWDELSIEDSAPENYTELSELYFKE